MNLKTILQQTISRQSAIGNVEKSGMLSFGSESNEEFDQMWDGGALAMGNDDYLRAVY